MTNQPNLPAYKHFDIICVFFVAALLISNIAAQKLFAFGPVTFTAGIIIFPVSYILGDVLTEVYGYARSRRVIWMGFGANLFMVVILWIAVRLPPAEGWPLQEQFQTILGQVPRVVFGSLVAYWAGEFSNSYVLAKMKVLSQGKNLWMRTIGSTLVGQAVDTCIFAIIVFYGVVPNMVIVKISIYGWAFKVAYEALITPVTYLVVNYLKKSEGIDHFDRDTNFNPFNISQ